MIRSSLYRLTYQWLLNLAARRDHYGAALCHLVYGLHNHILRICPPQTTAELRGWRPLSARRCNNGGIAFISLLGPDRVLMEGGLHSLFFPAFGLEHDAQNHPRDALRQGKVTRVLASRSLINECQPQTIRLRKEGLGYPK